MHIAGQPIELGDYDRAFALAGFGERRGELRATIERIRALAGFDLDILGNDFEAFSLGEPGERCTLRLEAEPCSKRYGRRQSAPRSCPRFRPGS